jgi:hypothetical protein
MAGFSDYLALAALQRVLVGGPLEERRGRRELARIAW